jgi:hypothetical protein
MALNPERHAMHKESGNSNSIANGSFWMTASQRRKTQQYSVQPLLLRPYN